MSSESVASARPPSAVRPAEGVVFHYTSADGLVAIVESRTVRVSEATGLNDMAEVRQGWDVVIKFLKARPDSAAAANLLDLSTYNDAWKASDTFVLCGSTEGDDANQWRLYGNEGRGYAIGFDSSVPFVALAASDVPEPPNLLPIRNGSVIDLGPLFRDSCAVSGWLHVLYKPEEIERALTELVEDFEAGAAALLAQTLGQQDRDVVRQEFEGEMYVRMARIAQLIKSPGFSGENEVRIVATFLSDTHHRFRGSRYGVVRFVPLTAAAQHAGQVQWAVESEDEAAERVMGRVLPSVPIKSVRMGPLLHPENNRYAVRGLLTRNGLGAAKVKKSKVPLR